MKDEDYILFDNYILDELSLEERKTFEERLINNSEFKKTFDTYKELSNYLENTFENESKTEAFKDDLKNVSEAYFKKTDDFVNNTKKSNVFKFARLAIAASVIIFMGFFVFNQLSGPSYSDYNSHPKMEVTVRSGGAEKITEAANAFNTKDYKKASLLLEDLLKNDPDNSELQLYDAIVNIELDQFKKADKTLEKIMKGQSVFVNQVTWYLALSKLKQNKNEDDIIKLLKQIPEDADHYEQVKDLLNKLD